MESDAHKFTQVFRQTNHMCGWSHYTHIDIPLSLATTKCVCVKHKPLLFLFNSHYTFSVWLKIPNRLVLGANERQYLRVVVLLPSRVFCSSRTWFISLVFSSSSAWFSMSPGRQMRLKQILMVPITNTWTISFSPIKPFRFFY